MKKLIRRARLRIDRALINLEVRLVLRKVRLEQERRARVANPGYDELRCPIFLSVMCFALIVLVVDVGDAWPMVSAFFAPLVTRVAGA